MINDCISFLPFSYFFSDNNQQFWNNEIFQRMKNGICAFIVVPGESRCYMSAVSPRQHIALQAEWFQQIVASLSTAFTFIFVWLHNVCHLQSLCKYCEHSKTMSSYSGSTFLFHPNSNLISQPFRLGSVKTWEILTSHAWRDFQHGFTPLRWKNQK